MSSDIKERENPWSRALRSIAKRQADGAARHDMNEAADYIGLLEQRIAELEAELEPWHKLQGEFAELIKDGKLTLTRPAQPSGDFVGGNND